MIAYDQAAAWTITREEARSMVHRINALRVSLALENGCIAAIPWDGPPLPGEARALLKEHRDAIYTYLTTPPKDTRPCAACGRPICWVLDPVGIWVCDCYYHPELHTWPEIESDQAGPAIVTQEQKTSARLVDLQEGTGQLLTESDQAAPGGSEKDRSSEATETRKPARVTGRNWRKKHGVLTDTRLFFFDGDEIVAIEIPPIVHLDDMLNWCAMYRVDTLWIQPGGQYSRWPADDRPASSWDVKPSTFEAEKGVMVLRNMSARMGRVWVTLTWPEWTAYEWNRHSLAALPDGETMLLALRYLSIAFDQEMNHNPGVMGRELMKRLNSTERRIQWVEQPSIDLATLPSWPGEGYHFKQVIEETEEYLAIWKVQHGITGPVYLHSWDKNSQYPDATKTVKLPCGDPNHVTSGIEAYLTGDKGQWKPRVGFWHIGEIRSRMGTPLYELNPLEDGQEWVSTPLLTLLHNQGQELAISEAYIWPESHAWLDTFGPTFWDARQSLKTDTDRFSHDQARVLAYHSAKRIGAASVGLLNSQDSIKYHPAWYRPDVWRFVIEEARAKLFFNVSKVFQEYGECPLMIATDGVYYLSGEKDPARVFPGCLTRPDDLGGWKHEFVIEATPEALACFNPEFSTGKTIRELREYRERNQQW